MTPVESGRDPEIQRRLDESAIRNVLARYGLETLCAVARNHPGTWIEFIPTILPRYERA